MKSRTLTCIITMMLFAEMAIPVRMSAQEQKQQKKELPRYTITELGTLGGTFSEAVGINNKSSVIGFSTLPGDRNVHAFLWRNGVMTDLRTLGGPNSATGNLGVGSFSPFSERGAVGGEAETSTPDPNGEDFCFFGTHLICLPFVWQDGLMTPLPTLGGNNGAANEINNRGQVAGVAESTTPVPPCLEGLAVPVIWEKGKIVQELPTFPGEQAGVALAINDKGQAAGFSASRTTLHALLWQNGTAADLGNLGGGLALASAINNQGQVTGQSNLPGDITSHGFLWQKGVMTDLGTLVGDFFSDAVGINSKTQVVGVSCDADGSCRVFSLAGRCDDGPPRPHSCRLPLVSGGVVGGIRHQ